MSRKDERNGATATTTTTTTTYEFPQPKEKLSIGQYIYNSKDGTVFGRDANSWSRLLLFYVIFYAVLAALFAICMQGLFATLNDKEPRWKLNSSLIGTNPGLGYRPIAVETEKGGLISFNTKNDSTKDPWIKLIDEFLAPYNNKSVLKNSGKNQQPCSQDNHNLKSGNVCDFDISDNYFSNCSKTHDYGFKNNRPCIFLKLNKIFDWVPDYYRTVEELPSDAPDNLREHLENHPGMEQVWISCHGQRPNDKDLINKIYYFPTTRGFAGYYYPYKNTDNYLSPLVAVQVDIKDSGYNNLVNIECRAWAKNIIYSGSLRDRKGSVTYQLLIDNNATEPINYNITTGTATTKLPISQQKTQ